MNCPHCRRALWYISGLSRPPHIKTYVCQSCNQIFGFVPLTFKGGHALWGGYRVVGSILRKTGYAPPAVMTKTPAKEGGVHGRIPSGHGSSDGEGGVEAQEAGVSGPQTAPRSRP